jgi:hypothetical protein
VDARRRARDRRERCFGGAGALVIVITMIVSAMGEDARACAVCATSDRTLSPAGAERPFAGRVRASLDARIGGRRFEQTSIAERRAEASVSVAVNPQFLASVGVPRLDRTIMSPAGARHARSFGDFELPARGIMSMASEAECAPSGRC